MNNIEFGKRYPIEISENKLMTLQYNFKPKSILEQSSKGQLDVSHNLLSSHSDVLLKLRSDDASEECFIGSTNKDTSINEFVLSFNKGNQIFNIHPISHEVCHLLHQRDDSIIIPQSKRSSKNKISTNNIIKELKKKRQKTTESVNDIEKELN